MFCDIAVPACSGSEHGLEGHFMQQPRQCASDMPETGNRQDGLLIAAGALHGAIAVTVSAFAAHGLEGRLPPEGLGWVDTGARVQMLHALALLATAAISTRKGAIQWLRLAQWGFFLGAALFAGSLYLRAATDIAAVTLVTPVGGAILILSWVCLLIYGVRLAGRSI